MRYSVEIFFAKLHLSILGVFVVGYFGGDCLLVNNYVIYFIFIFFSEVQMKQTTHLVLGTGEKT